MMMIIFLFDKIKPVKIFRKAYLMNEMTLAGACRANKGTRKGF
jgi:hypothetical protein